jgi:hypothetical protein
LTARIEVDLATQSLDNRTILRQVPAHSITPRTAAQTCLQSLAMHAWRRRPSAHELERLLTLFEESFRENSSFPTAVGEAAKAILVSPAFLMVAEPETGREGDYPLGPEQLATRMALFSGPRFPTRNSFQRPSMGSSTPHRKFGSRSTAC